MARNLNPIWNPASRRNSREWAVQALFFLDANPPHEGLEQAIADFWAMQVRSYDDSVTDKLKIADKIPPSDDQEEPQLPEVPYSQRLDAAAPQQLREFANSLVRGTWTNIDQIDAKIETYLQNWVMSRIGGVDRAVLRLAAYELFFSEETPPVVIVNEAVDIAKYFSTRDSGRFVNGILDRAIKDVTRHPREAAKKGKYRRPSTRGKAQDKPSDKAQDKPQEWAPDKAD